MLSMNVEGPVNILAKKIIIKKAANLRINHPFCKFEKKVSSILVPGCFHQKQYKNPLIISNK